jgi:membrane-associated PAP2 superfamily phosphatase
MTGNRRHDALITLLGLGLLAAWDSAGWDLPLMHLLGNASGFVWREAAVLNWLHTGGRSVAWGVLAWMGWMAFAVPRQAAQAASSAQQGPLHRRYWFAMTLLCLLLINIIKYASATSCPWDLAEFGGIAHHVSHWAILVRDGGPGQCFPSGHSSAAFGFFSLYFLFRRHDSQRAKRYLAAVCAAGVVVSLTQIARGAHYPSHALWTAWLCWTTCCAADAARGAWAAEGALAKIGPSVDSF